MLSHAVIMMMVSIAEVYKFVSFRLREEIKIFKEEINK